MLTRSRYLGLAAVCLLLWTVWQRVPDAAPTRHPSGAARTGGHARSEESNVLRNEDVHDGLATPPSASGSLLSPGPCILSHAPETSNAWCPWDAPANASRLPDARCHADSGHCGCMTEWLGGYDPCADPAVVGRRKQVTINILHGWIQDELHPYKGLHLCPKTLCNVNRGASRPAVASYRNVDNIGLIPGGDERIGLAAGVIAENPETHELLRDPALRPSMDVAMTLWPTPGYEDIWISYNEASEAQFRNPPIMPFSEKREPLLFLAGRCVDWRQSLRDQIESLHKVDGVGACGQNIQPEQIDEECAKLKGIGGPSFEWINTCLLRHYKFYLAFENSQSENYTTEKLWRGMQAGAVPIYAGAPNVRDYLPDHDSVVLVSDFPSIADLVAYIKKASADETLYIKHHAWRSKPWPAKFQTMVDAGRHKWNCALCDFAAEHPKNKDYPFKYGLDPVPVQ